MCNAWNHSPGCTCGWGGDGHLGRRPDDNIYSNGVRAFDTRSLDSYTVRNAKCPVCGASVFFYKSEHGGRVFFDELGPPWPKHPCTDNIKNSYQFPTAINSFFAQQPTWQKNGWVPVVINNLSGKSAYAFSIERIDTYFSVGLNTMIYGSYAADWAKSDLIIFAKRKDKENFTLAAFDVNDQKTFDLDFNHAEQKLDAFFDSQTRFVVKQFEYDY